MSIASVAVKAAVDTPVEMLDALVIGGGVSGIYQLYCLRKLGLI
jgi:cation diffusion facilitator CzcD-associated flavoprotein CzcO